MSGADDKQLSIKTRVYVRYGALQQVGGQSSGKSSQFAQTWDMCISRLPTSSEAARSRAVSGWSAAGTVALSSSVRSHSSVRLAWLPLSFCNWIINDSLHFAGQQQQSLIISRRCSLATGQTTKRPQPATMKEPINRNYERYGESALVGFDIFSHPGRRRSLYNFHRLRRRLRNSHETLYSICIALFTKETTTDLVMAEEPIKM